MSEYNSLNDPEHLESNEKLIPFLRNLADAIERRQLLPQQLQSIGEFFMSYQFQEQAIKDGDTSSTKNTEHQFDHKELVKFLCLGWYVYCVILRNETLPDMSND
jgi:hypothetical protein